MCVKRFRLLSLLALAIGAMPAADLDKLLRERAAAGPGKVFLAAKNLATGKTMELNGSEKVRTASTIKLPLLVEVFAQVAEGTLRLDEELTLRKNDIVSGSGVLRELSPGTKLRLRDVANLMIVVSDNSATNMLIERVTAEAVNQRMDALGLPATRLMRKVRGDGNNLTAPQGFSKAGMLEVNKKWGLGSTTSWEMVKLLEMLHTGKVSGATDMIAILKRQQYTDGIARRIGEIEVASKSGSLDHLRSDVALVYTKQGPIAIAITVEDIPGVDYGVDNPGLLQLADLAKIVVEHLGN
jgi:beta-lactamase class A